MQYFAGIGKKYNNTTNNPAPPSKKNPPPYQTTSRIEEGRKVKQLTSRSPHPFPPCPLPFTLLFSPPPPTFSCCCFFFSSYIVNKKILLRISPFTLRTRAAKKLELAIPRHLLRTQGSGAARRSCAGILPVQLYTPPPPTPIPPHCAGSQPKTAQDNKQLKAKKKPFPQKFASPSQFSLGTAPNTYRPKKKTCINWSVRKKGDRNTVKAHRLCNGQPMIASASCFSDPVLCSSAQTPPHSQHRHPNAAYDNKEARTTLDSYATANQHVCSAHAKNLVHIRSSLHTGKSVSFGALHSKKQANHSTCFLYRTPPTWPSWVFLFPLFFAFYSLAGLSI